MTESIHGDVASFVANALEPDEDAAFTEHLATCSTCRDELVWLSGITLALADQDAGRPADGGHVLDAGTGATGDAEDGNHTGTDIAAAGRGWRVAGWLAVAAAAVLLALGGGVGFLIGHSSAGVVAAPQDPVQVLFDTGTVHRAGSAASHVTADVAVVPSRGGVDVGLRLADPLGPKQCELIVVGRDGDQQTAMTWSVPSEGFGSGSSGPLLARGQVGFRPDQIARFEIQSAGRTLLVIPA